MTAQALGLTIGGAALTEPAAEAWLPHLCFTHGPPGRIGLELELIPVPLSGAGTRMRPPAVLREALAQVPLGAALTVEPGGQVELSGPPADDLPTALTALATDLRRLRRVAASHGWGLAGHGLQPGTLPPRILDLPRYAAMEAYLDRSGDLPGAGPAGRLMMRGTASVQVNVEAAVAGPRGGDGPAEVVEAGERWALLHAVAPALIAAFANSPLHAGRPTGWKSTRQAVWLTLDPARTRPPVTGRHELAGAWSRWCLDAPLMLVRRPRGAWTAPPGLTFREWIRHGTSAVPDRPPPTVDDLAYHLTTLFPPVRARGHLEVRYLDAQPGPWWVVPPAVLAALLSDRAVADLARDACAPVAGRWRGAARLGPADPELARAARTVLGLAAGTLLARPGTRGAGRAVRAFAERWTARGRCPADDLLENPC